MMTRFPELAPQAADLAHAFFLVTEAPHLASDKIHAKVEHLDALTRSLTAYSFFGDMVAPGNSHVPSFVIRTGQIEGEDVETLAEVYDKVQEYRSVDKRSFRTYVAMNCCRTCG